MGGQSTIGVLESAGERKSHHLLSRVIVEMQTFNQWLHEGNRYEALQDVYFEDRLGPGSDFLEWVQSMYQAKQALLSDGQKAPSWPFS